MAMWSHYIILLVITSNNILQSLIIILTLPIVTGLYSQYTKSHLSFIENQPFLMHTSAYYCIVEKCIKPVIILQFWYLLTNILFVEIETSLMRSH